LSACGLSCNTALKPKTRFSILHQAASSIQTDLLYFALTTIATIIIGFAVFRIAEYKARRDGLIDKKEEY
jgi:hypothetical protein